MSREVERLAARLADAEEIARLQAAQIDEDAERVAALERERDEAQRALRELMRTSARQLNPTLATQSEWENAERNARAVASTAEHKEDE
jgi:hypothetical protein